MKCPSCQFENPDDNKFCRECGTAFLSICSKCGNELQTGDKFCGKCGNKIKKFTEDTKSTTPDLEGERKHVTVLFSDLSGYTAMSERLDPEEVKRIMSWIFGEVAQIVTKYEGFIEKFIGDAVMALFGVPQTHEDDTLRAIKAAIEIHTKIDSISSHLKEKIAQPILMHSGINTGLVVTGKADIDKGTHGVVGDTVNLASRLADKAKPGEILISLDTYRLSASYFKFKKIESLSIKGKEKPVSAFKVEDELRFATLYEASAKQRLTVFTGREQELASLQSCLKKTFAGEGQFITIVGEAGAGKSRLLYEFLNSIDKKTFEVWQGYCQSFWSAANYFPFIKMLRIGLHLTEETNVKDLHSNAASNIRAINGKLEKYLPYYMNLLSIPSKDHLLPEHIEGQELQFAFQSSIAAICTCKSEKQPLILILEDWQWADQASISTLEHMISLISKYPLMVITVYRPVYSANWGNWSHHTPLVLKSLEDSDSENIVKSALGAGRLPEGLMKLITKRTGGNPFFIEEICRSLIEDGVIEVHEDKHAILSQSLETLTIPEKVQAIIGARFDRLDIDAKKVLRIASVIGRRFERHILEKIYKGKILLSEVLSNLKALEIIQQTRVFPESEFWFKHALTKDVVYNSLLIQRRKVLHKHIGEIIEEHNSKRIEEHVNLLQYHFSMAEDWSKAVQYGRMAADKATKLSQFQETVDLLEQVLDWLLYIPEDRLRLETQIDILLQQERLYETLGQRDKQQKIIDKLTTLAQSEKDQATLSEIYIRQADLYTQLSKYDKAERALNDAIFQCRSISDSLGESRALRSMGFLRWHQIRYDDAIKCNEEALAIDRQREDPMTIATDLTNLGAVWRNIGDLDRSLKFLNEALEIYETKNKLGKLAFTLYSIAHVYQDRNESDNALTKYEQAHEIFEQYNDRIMSSRAVAGIAGIYRKQGKIHESLNLYQDVVKATREVQYRQGLSHALDAAGELLLILNSPRKALNHFIESTKVFAELKDIQSEAEIWHKIGNIYTERLDQHRLAIEAWAKKKELQILINDYCGAIETLERMAELARKKLDDSTLAIRYFQDALKIALHTENHRKQGKLLNTIGILQWHQKEYARALKNYEKAYEIYFNLEDSAHAGLMLNSIGKTMHKLGSYEDALDRLRKAVEINRRCGEQLLQGHGLAAMGDIYYDLGEHELSIDHYERSLELRRKIGDNKGQGWMLHSLALVYSDINRYGKAREYLTKARAIAEEYDDTELVHSCNQVLHQFSDQFD